MSAEAVRHILLPWAAYVAILAAVFAACVWAAVVDGRKQKSQSGG